MSAITRDASHNYYYEGRQYRGVTDTLKVIDKSAALMSWAAKHTAQAALDLYDGDGLAQLLATVGREGAIKALTARANWQRDEAAALGTEVHRLADLVVRGEPTPSMDETTRGRVLAYAQWWKSSGWTLRLSEAMLLNITASYGGTCDLLAYDRDGKTVMADIKTGKAVYQEAVLQLTAYGMAELIQPASDNVMAPATVYPMPKVDRHVILHVTADAVREVEVTVGSLEQIAWLACLDLATWRDSVKGKRL